MPHTGPTGRPVALISELPIVLGGTSNKKPPAVASARGRE